MQPRVSVVIPTHNEANVIATTLRALRRETPAGVEVIVVDDGSVDDTAQLAAGQGVRVIQADGRGSAGGARNLGWDAARGDVIVFLDADDVPGEGWGLGLRRALAEHPGAIIGCARTFVGHTPWEWIGHLQLESPRLPRGDPREVGFLASFCLVVPASAPLRWDESYGGEDTVFCFDARAAGLRLVFDPRFATRHVPHRDTFADVRAQQRKLAYELARAAPAALEGRHKQVLARVPVHYFALVRLPIIYRRVRRDPELRRRFLQVLPRLALAEWLLGLSALRYVLRRPPFRSPTAGPPHRGRR